MTFRQWRALDESRAPQMWNNCEYAMEQAWNAAQGHCGHEAQIAALSHDIQAYRGALGYSVPGDHDGILSDGRLPINGIAEAQVKQIAALEAAIGYSPVLSCCHSAVEHARHVVAERDELKQCP